MSSNTNASDTNANPKISPDPASNQLKDPDDWVTGEEPMTGAQASYLKTLSEEAGVEFRSESDEGRCFEAD